MKNCSGCCKVVLKNKLYAGSNKWKASAGTLRQTWYLFFSKWKVPRDAFQGQVFSLS